MKRAALLLSLTLLLIIASSCGGKIDNDYIPNEVKTSALPLESVSDVDVADILETNGGEETNLTLFSESTARISEDMPVFAFRTYSYSEHLEFVHYLHIVDTETDEVIDKFAIMEFPPYGW